MLVKYLLPALAAIGSARAQSAVCTVSTTTIKSQAEATELAKCRTVGGTVVVDSKLGGTLDLSGPREITGDLRVVSNKGITNLQSNDLEKIGGSFTVRNAESLNAIQFPKLSSVEKLEWQTLNALITLDLGPITEAEEVTVSDTNLRSLDGIDLKSVRKLDINNNAHLTKFTTQLHDLSDNLNIQANGLNLEVALPNLVWIANMTISNVTEFSIPALRVVNGSARFDSNYFESFIAPNLTHTESGDISFVGNGKLDNLTFPKLTSIGGGLLIANNTELSKIDAFPQLESVGGAIKLRGSFKDIKFPKLDIVRGAFDASSTADIRKSCERLKELAPSSQGGKGNVEGVFTCTSENENANDDVDGGIDGSGQIDGEDSDGSGAAGLSLNTALFGLVAIAAVASAL